MQTQMVDQAWIFPDPTYGNIWVCKAHTGYWFACTGNTPLNINDEWWDLPANTTYLPIERLRRYMEDWKTVILDNNYLPDWTRIAETSKTETLIEYKDRFTAIMEE